MAKVLVVDDAAFMRMKIRQTLEDAGHETIGEAENGIEAIQKFVSLKPDVVLLDVAMPEMNGVETLKRLKDIEPEAKVVMCTAAGQQAIVADAIQYGANGFIVKPFEPRSLVDTVNRTACC